MKEGYLLKCHVCGGSMIGDGYREPRRCENAEIDFSLEPDVEPIYCGPEIANCPLCGNALQMDQWRWPECTACPFRCALSDLPRISAAMGLAKAEVAFDKAHDVSDDRLENAVNTMADVVLEKLHRVLEVFK